MTYTTTHSENDFELIVDARQEVANDTIEISFVSSEDSELPAWEPGSHIDLFLSNGQTRQYSLVPDFGGKNRWVISVLVEKEGRGGSLLIDESFQPGKKVKARGTRNHFKLEPAKSLLFIAGGIGVTPLLAMIMRAEESSIPWKLFYLGRSKSSMAYLSMLQEKYGEKISIFSKESGERLDVKQTISNLDSDTHVYCCGPESLMLEVENSFDSSQRFRCNVERFLPREITKDAPDEEFEVYCQKSDLELIIPADESIFMTADFAGLEIEGDCMEGTCGSCETRVISGTVDHRDSILSPDEQKNGDTMMICVSRGRGRLVLDL